ncbi:MAG: methionine--tRNA ligase [Planctomycetes bacterium]|jgi:methionyl-tRNA synthetase|nr:methionine--tRNA ligase [Phycisphaerae bacterium]NBB95103.1 methionine--tRNA ligase [Planctomycetota bacterium]
MSETYYVTTPIYYVNDVPHIGHSYTTIAADVLARFFRAAGRDVRFLTGTDEHGVKIYKAAQERNMGPDELGDQVVVHFQQLWDDLNISHDDFIRTTEDRHEKRVQKLVQTLLDADEIYKGQYEGWYDEGQEEYVTETTAKANNYNSAINGKPLVRYSEANWFFRLGKWAPKLIEHIEAKADFIQPAARRSEVLSKLKQGVDDLCISRNKTKLPWGVEMPNDPNYVVYVWIDALSNYLNALGLPEIGDEFDGKFAKYWPATVHLIGKDILWFHAVYWPCILLAAGYDLPMCVYAHGWWTSEGKKMSKSLGNFISREEIAEICGDYHRDVYRYYLLRAVNFGGDGDFSREMFKQTYNADLANGVGNLLSRTINMIGRYFDGEVPQPAADVEETAAVTGAAEALRTEAERHLESCSFGRYIDSVLTLVDAANGYIEVTEPFKLAKDDSQRDRLSTIMNACGEACRLILTYLAPVMPEKAAEGLAAMGVDADETTPLAERGQWGRIAAGTTVTKIDPLFPRKQ